MHTSQALSSSHFRYRRIGHAASGVAPNSGAQFNEFSSFCARYHEQDRVGVVSPRLEDGILHTAYALLALTTAFYDAQRARASDFFIYPQHFAIIGADHNGVETGIGRLDLTLDEAGMGGAWSWLDVWPASNWLTAPGTPADMIQKVFDFQINRLFWPHNFKARRGNIEQRVRNSARKPGDYAIRPRGRPQDQPLLPDYARKLLKARLKSVHYYNTPAPTVEISAAQAAADIVQESIERLPEAVQRALPQQEMGKGGAHQGGNGLPSDQTQPSSIDPSADDYPYRESYRQVNIDDFLQDIDACFM